MVNGNNNEINASVVLQPDEQSIKQTQVAVAKVLDGVELRDLTNQINIKPTSLPAELPMSQLPQSGSNDAIEKTTADLEDAFEAADRYNSKIREQAGLLGDVDTALSAIGAGSIGSLFGAAEGAVQLSAAAKGLGASIKATITSLGAMGVAAAAMGVAGVAAWNHVKNEADKAAAAIERQIDALRSSYELSATGTQETIDLRLEQIEIERQVNERLANSLKTQIDAANAAVNAQNPLWQGLYRLGDAIGIYGAELDAVNSKYDEARDALSELAIEEERLLAARDDQAVVARTLSNALIDDAELAGERIRIEARAKEASAETNRERLKQIETERQAIEAQLGVLQTAPEKTDQVTREIERLQNELEKLGVESEIVSKYTADQANATDDLSEAQEEAERAAERAADALRKYDETVADIERDGARELADIRTDFKRDEIDAARDAANERIEAQIDAYEKLQDVEKEHRRKINDILKDARRNELDAAFDFDFSRLFQIREQLADAIDDQNETAAEQRSDTLEDFQEAQADQRRHNQELAAERRTNLQRELADARLATNRKLQDAATALQRELELSQNGIQNKLQLENQYWQQSIGIAQRALAAMGRLPNGFGGGGVVNRNNQANVTQNNTFNGGQFDPRQLQRITQNIIRQEVAGLFLG
ncbi:MAG: hypothetical protein D6712_15225 [Chloroflexi bacterium]|nr:MAG: hypothetical protein D6712_15225 [Chloroflexota bacterium]